jgi:hypothetical protein
MDVGRLLVTHATRLAQHKKGYTFRSPTLATSTALGLAVAD